MKERERGANAPRWIDRYSNLTLPSRFPSTAGPKVCFRTGPATFQYLRALIK